MEILVDGKQVKLRYMKKPHIRNAYLRFKGDVLVVTARDERKAEQIIRENRTWIERHYRSISESRRLFESNSILFSGRRFIALLDKAARNSVEANADVIIFRSRNEDSAERLLDRWLSERSIGMVSDIVISKAKEHGIEFMNIGICRGSRWGSCSSKKELKFNKYICMIPIDIAEYVVAHELAHTLQLNHSHAFWDEVKKICPEYRTLRKELRNYDSYRRAVFTKLE
jgi:Predicted metal-dependent hydrolase